MFRSRFAGPLTWADINDILAAQGFERVHSFWVRGRISYYQFAGYPLVLVEDQEENIIQFRYESTSGTDRLGRLWRPVTPEFPFIQKGLSQADSLEAFLTASRSQLVNLIEEGSVYPPRTRPAVSVPPQLDFLSGESYDDRQFVSFTSLYVQMIQATNWKGISDETFHQICLNFGFEREPIQNDDLRLLLHQNGRMILFQAGKSSSKVAFFTLEKNGFLSLTWRWNPIPAVEITLSPKTETAKVEFERAAADVARRLNAGDIEG